MNFAFDVTPAELITGITTIQEAEERLQDQIVSDLLADALQQRALRRPTSVSVQPSQLLVEERERRHKAELLAPEAQMRVA